MKVVNIEFPLKSSMKLTEPEAVKVMMAGLQKLIEFGAIRGNIDDILRSYEFTDKLGYAIAVVDKDCIIDASKLNSIGASYVYHVDPINPKTEEDEIRQFSVATIQERLRISSMDPKIRFRLTIQDYKKYWKGSLNKIKAKPEMAKRLRNMFLVDLMGIFSEILPYIQEGKQLAALIGVNAITDGLTTSSRELSNAYRKALNQSKTGQISKGVYTGLQAKYSEFVNLLIPQIFPGIDDILKSTSESENKSFSGENNGGILTIVADDVEKLRAIISEIEVRTKNNHIAIVNIKDSEETTDGITYHIEPSVGIHNIDKKQFEYEETPTGKIFRKSTVIKRSFKM
jgi:hypothetical protein